MTYPFILCDPSSIVCFVFFVCVSQMKCWSLLVRGIIGPLMSLLSLIHEVLCLLWVGGGTVATGCSDWLPGRGSLSLA